MSDYTEGEWKLHQISNSGYTIESDTSEDVIARVEYSRANAQRIVACVNGCQGINPDDVKDVIRALIKCRTILDTLIVNGHIDRHSLEVDASLASNEAFGAMNKAKGEVNGKVW